MTIKLSQPKVMKHCSYLGCSLDVRRRKKMGGFKLFLTDWLISKDIHSEITNKKIYYDAKTVLE